MKKTTCDPNRHVPVAVLLALLALCASFPLILLDRAPVAQAQGPQANVACDPRGMVLVHYEKIKLGLRQEDVPRAPQPRGRWYEESITLLFDIKGDELICLSSRLDGLGPIWVDDAAQMFIKNEPSGVENEWEFNFYDIKTGLIKKDVPAQDLTRKFGRGTPHIIRTVLWDYHAPEYGNSNLYLIIYRRPTPTPTNTFTPTATRTFTPTPTATPTSLFPILISSVSPTTVEQGRPFTLTAEIIPHVPLQRLTAEATIKAGGGGILQEKIVFTKQEFAEKPNLFVAKFAPIEKIGIYYLTLHVEGTGHDGIVYGKDNRLDKTVELRVVERSLPIWISSISPTTVEQGRPFTVTAEIVPRISLQRITSQATIRAGGGGIVGKTQVLTKQEYADKSNIFAASFDPIEQMGTYVLIVHVEAVGQDGAVYGKDNELDKTLELVVVEPGYWLIVRTASLAGLALLVLLLLLRYSLSPKPQGGFVLATSIFGRASNQYYDFKNRSVWRRLLIPSKVYASEIGLGSFYVIAEWRVGRRPGWPFILQEQTYLVALVDGLSLGGKLLTPQMGWNQSWLRFQVSRFVRYLKEVKSQRRLRPYMSGTERPPGEPSQELLVENLVLMAGSNSYKYQSQPPDQKTAVTGGFRPFTPFGSR